MNRIRRALSLGVLFIAALAAVPAMAAQDYDSCTGFIDTVPASIGTQGTWCLRGHKYTSQISGQAISVLADNVTIDCNQFRLSGLGAGAATNASGIFTDWSRRNVTVRNCRIQGFWFGTRLLGANHLVERNRFDYSTFIGVYLIGDHGVIRDNEVMATGGGSGGSWASGIYVDGLARVSGNTVHGVMPKTDVGDRYAYGMHASGLIEDNHVSGLDPTAQVFGIVASKRSVIRRNTLVQAAQTVGSGIRSNGPEFSVCRDNDIILYQFDIEGCGIGPSNLFLPAFVIG